MKSSSNANQARSADGKLVIRDIESLQIWRRQLRAVTAGPLPTILFELGGLSHEQNRAVSGLADRYRRACGCGTASLAMSAAILATVAGYFVRGGEFGTIGLMQIVVLLGIAALAMIAGKLGGLLWARWQLLRLASRLSGSIAGTA